MKVRLSNGIINTIVDILESTQFLQKATGITSYALYRNYRILKENLKDYKNAINNTMRKYSVESNGTFYLRKDDKESMRLFTEEILMLANIEIEVDLFQIDKRDIDLPYWGPAMPNEYELIEALLMNPE